MMTNGKAGGSHLNHNETLAAGLRVRTALRLEPDSGSGDRRLVQSHGGRPRQSSAAIS